MACRRPVLILFVSTALFSLFPHASRAADAEHVDQRCTTHGTTGVLAPIIFQTFTPTVSSITHADIQLLFQQPYDGKVIGRILFFPGQLEASPVTVQGVPLATATADLHSSGGYDRQWVSFRFADPAPVVPVLGNRRGAYAIEMINQEVGDGKVVMPYSWASCGDGYAEGAVYSGAVSPIGAGVVPRDDVQYVGAGIRIPGITTAFAIYGT